MTDSLILQCRKCGARNRVPRARLNDGPRCGKCKALLSSENMDTRPVVVTDATFEREITSHGGVVLLDCWAAWCGPCKSMEPILNDIAKRFAGRIKVAKLNVDDNPGTASKFRIMSIPTLLFFKNGKLVDTAVGALPVQEIERHINSLL